MTLAGVVATSKTKTTKNNTLMAYVTLEDATGTIELMVFSRTLAEGGQYLKVGLPIGVAGRISQRDEKAPQLMVDWIGPLAQPAPGEEGEEPQPKTLWIKLPDGGEPMEWLKRLLNMFPGKERTVVYLQDSGKRLQTHCLHHPALMDELREVLGETSVVLR